MAITPNVEQSPKPTSSDATFAMKGEVGGPNEDIPPYQLDTQENPTISHALADESIQCDSEQGASQVSHDAIEVQNLGWNADEDAQITQPLVQGLKNEKLWTLIRRFDKQTFAVRRIRETPLGQLDMNVADKDEFSPDKLRAHFERLYISVITCLISLGNHVARLRSWKESQRTCIYLTVYTAAWLLDLIIPASIIFVIVLILSPWARDISFPPAPLALIDSKSGGIQKPAAGVLATDNTATGAPEALEGEALEHEAHNWINSISTLIVGIAVGKHPRDDGPEADDTPDPAKLARNLSGAEENAARGKTSAESDKTKKPISRAVGNKAGPVMHAVIDFVDTWERFGNALSPISPFPKQRPRIVLASTLLPLLLLSCYVTPYLVVKGLGFVLGLVLFGQPVLSRAADFLERTYPKWQKLVELRNSILKGIPTNAQLAITLLRIGERNTAPVPPPPTSDHVPVATANQQALEGLDDDLGESEADIQAIAQPTKLTEEDNADEEQDNKSKPSKGRALLNAFKGAVKGSVKTGFTVDRIKAVAGAHRAKERIGVVKKVDHDDLLAGPVRFEARYKGNKGYAYVTNQATTPALSWTASIDDVDEEAWTILISDIENVTKVGGLCWTSKVVVGWALEKEIIDGLVIKTTRGQEFHLTAVMVRDQVFNRLIAIGGSMWEIY